MKISINKIGTDMAELHRLAIAFDESNIESEHLNSPLYKASDEAFERIDHLKELLTFQRPDCIGDILILALMAANHLERLQPARLPRELRSADTDQFLNANKVKPVLRLLDAIITGIEKQAKLTREDLDLGFLREREDDREQIFEKALDVVMEPEAKDQKTKKAA